MRSKLVASLLVALFVTGCSQNGTVVEKRLKPSPFAYSAGIDAIYTFLLRDGQGRVHSQMVTPDVFSRYQVGDYFDDRQSGSVRRDGFSKDSTAVADSKEVKPVHRHTARRQHQASTASHKPKHHHLRAIAKTREERSQIAAPLMPRDAMPERHGLDVRP
jgi:hypothetical protein